MKKLITSIFLGFFFVWAGNPSALAQADFTADTLSGCAPLVVNFQDLSQNAASWSWNLGGGVTSSLQNPGRIFQTPGVYTISLTITDSSGQTFTATKTQYITVFAGPSVNFGANADTLCKGDTLRFSDLTQPGSAGIASWLWDFGDGNGSTLANPVHIYAQAGSFNVTLSVSDSNGCNDLLLRPHFITVNAPDAGFTANPASGCQAPLNVQFLPFTQAGTHFWNFGDGNTSTLAQPAHIYQAIGNYTVTHVLVDGNGCRDTIELSNYIRIGSGSIAVQASPLVICPGDTVRFSAAYPPLASARWDFGDGDSALTGFPAHVYQNPGVYTVNLRVLTPGSCTLLGSTVVTVRQPPAVAFSTPDTLSCSNPFAVSFSDLTPNAVQWLWDFGNGATATVQNPVFTYNYPGAYDIKLVVTDAFGCTDSVLYPGYISVGAITADFAAMPGKGCAPLEVAFRVLDPSPRNNPPEPNTPALSSWRWSFGDGNTSTLPNPVHTYQNSGNYSVRLIVANAGGCADTLLRQAVITVGDSVQADFSVHPDTGCADTVFTFLNLSTGNVTLSHWLYGDGGEDYIFNGAHTYRDTGAFTVTLIVEDNGCADTLEKEVRVLPPVSRFGLSPGIGCDTPVTVTFTDNSIGADSWLWDFGDGSPPSTLPNPTHTFSGVGSYAVTLTVTNATTGCDDQSTRPFLVQPLSAGFAASVTQGCAPLTVQFTDASPNASFWEWNFQDGSRLERAQNPVHTFTRAGVYHVSLLVRNPLGCSDDTVMAIPIVVGDPMAAFVAADTTGCAPFLTVLTDLSQSLLPIVGWNWNLGSGISSQQNPTAQYGPGYFDVQLIVTDSVGCRDTLRKRDYIFVSQPVPGFSATFPINCPGNGIRFLNNSQGQGLQYRWSFGDGDSSAFLSPTHTYSQTGFYSVSLTVTDINGCDSTLTRPAYIQIADPQIDFSADTTFGNCPPLLVNFNGVALSPHPFNSWRWNFGNGNQGFQQNASNLYSQPGLYAVNLIATTAYGCADTMQKPGFIQLNGPRGSFSFSPAAGCPGVTVNFSASGSNVSQFEWDMDDGTLLQGPSVQHVYHSPGVYHPQLILTDSTGCRVLVNSPDSIVVYAPPVADFGASTTLLCDSGVVNFSSLSQPSGSIAGFWWNLGNGNSSSLSNPSQTYAPGGPYSVSLIVTDTLGCRDTVEKNSFIRVAPSPSVRIVPGDSIGCPPLRIGFRYLPVSGSVPLSAWQWDFGVPGGSSTLPADTFVYQAAGSYTVTLTVTDLNGCSGDTSTTVTVRPPPQPDFMSNLQTGCAPVRVQFTSLTPGNIVAWFWDFGDGNTSNLPNPSHVYQKDTVYTVRLRVVDVYGCEGEIVKPNYLNFSPQPTPVVDAGPDVIKICFGDSVLLPGTATNLPSVVQYSWTPSIGLSDSSLQQPMASPGFTTTYFFTAQAPGCASGPADSLRVEVHTLPTVDPGPDQAICLGDSVKLPARAGGDWDPNTTYRFEWSPAAGLSDPNTAQPMASPGSSTLYRLEVTSSHGCKAPPQNVRVEVLPTPLAYAGPDRNLCFGDSLQLQGSHSFLTGPPPPGQAFYAWSPATQILGRFTFQPTVFPQQTTSYVLTVSFGACQSRDTVPVNVLAAAQARAAADSNALCAGDTLRLSATDSLRAGARYSWSPATGLSDPLSPYPLAFPTQSTTYQLSVNEAGCLAQDSLQITVFPKPDANFDQRITENCDEFEVLFDANAPNASYLIWDFGDGSPPANGPRQVHTYTVPGTYIPVLTAVGAGGCRTEVNGDPIEVIPAGIAAFASEPDTGEILVLPQAQVRFLDLSSGAVSWNWDFGDGGSSSEASPVHVFRSPGLYRVELTVVDQRGCVHSYALAPYVVREPDLFIPNVFSPNGDGINEVFRPEYSGVENYALQVFDRWGKLMFSHEGDPAVGWNGNTPSGAQAREGVYYYTVQTGNKVYRGNVVLMR